MNKEKNILKSKKGITLVALVVTVIVLSILAGVSINLVISDDGLILKSKETKERQEVIQEKEHIKIAILDSQIRDASTSEIIKDKLEISLQQQLGTNVKFTLIENGSGNFTIKMNDSGRTYYLENTGRIVDDENILEISTAEELKAFRDKVNNGNTFEGKVICLTNDITLDINEEWTPIGLYFMENNSPFAETNKPFKGTFDGRGYEVDNIYINTTDKVQGLFGLVSDDGKILNLSIGENSNITGGLSTAGVVGYLNNGSIVSNCYNEGNIKGTVTAGIVGFSNKGIITDCYNKGNIEGESKTAGVVGECKTNSEVFNCYNTGNINASLDKIGGVVGNLSDSSISNCYNIGKVEGAYYVGGIVGYITSSNVISCYNLSDVIAESSTEWGNSVVGGICGINIGSEIKDVYNTGAITGEYSYVGGILGVNRGTLTNSYNIGSLSGDVSGGIVGRNDSHSGNKGIINNSYSLENDTLEIYGSNIYIISPECSEKSSDELKAMASTLGDAFKNDEENINEGYPILSWQ